MKEYAKFCSSHYLLTIERDFNGIRHCHYVKQ